VRQLVNAVVADIASGSGSAPTIGVLFGSHNWDSIRLILKEFTDAGLMKPIAPLLAEHQVSGFEVPDEQVLQIPDHVTDRVTLAQLFGMSNALTNYIVERTRSNAPFVIKYVPYGALSEVSVLPFSELQPNSCHRSCHTLLVVPLRTNPCWATERRWLNASKPGMRSANASTCSLK
jgi:hypothetical protein